MDVLEVMQWVLQYVVVEACAVPSNVYVWTETKLPDDLLRCGYEVRRIQPKFSFVACRQFQEDVDVRRGLAVSPRTGLQTIYEPELIRLGHPVVLATVDSPIQPVHDFTKQVVVTAALVLAAVAAGDGT